MMASGTARRDGQREAIAGDGGGVRAGRYGGSFGTGGQPLGGYAAPGSMERH
jgi:hypothetical protein